MPKAKSYKHETQWPVIRTLAEQNSTEKLLESLQRGEDVYERLALHRFALRFLSFRPWNGRNLDVVVAVCDAGIKTAAQAAEEIPDDSSWFREEASQMAFTTSQNLCACWDDGFGRSPEHAKKGLELAKLAIELRLSLKKNGAAVGTAWNSKGVHELTLNKIDQALQSFAEAKRLFTEHATKRGTPTSITPAAPHDLLLTYGFAAMGRIRSGAVSADADKELKAVIQTFEGMKSGDASTRETAEISLEQLNSLHRNLTNA